ncbi:MAG: hypothetical protein K0Q90_2320 [Paenibacillaceae bacterium]|jgi:hypothetical protein|nr:hypothetical protein [Paenibacillaceae bacterium]
MPTAVSSPAGERRVFLFLGKDVQFFLLSQVVILYYNWDNNSMVQNPDLRCNR